MQVKGPNQQLQRDMTLYEEAMYRKALREGRTDADARLFARQMVQTQTNVEQERLKKVTAERLKWKGTGR